MKNSFTLIELLFVIVIIGLLAIVALPNFSNLTSHAKKASIKTVVNSVNEAIENIHSEWLVNESMTTFNAEDGSTQPLNSSGYPEKLDSGKGESRLFKYVLKSPVIACNSNSNFNCWREYEDKKYEYIFSSSKILKMEYNDTKGLLECIDGEGINKEDCENIIY